MQHNKQIRSFARKLVQLSLDEQGQVSSEKVGAILSALQSQPSRRLQVLLREYYNLLRREIRKSEAVVEYAGGLSDATLEDLRQKLSGIYQRPVTAIKRPNEKLIAGVRISIGDDVYDASVANRLAQLAKAFR